VTLQVDEALAPHAVRQGIDVFNLEGKTPMMIACEGLHFEVVEKYVLLGADPRLKDPQHHDCLWHLFHGSREEPHHLLCNENQIGSGSGKEAERDITRFTAEVLAGVTLLSKGCGLYSDDNFSVHLEDMVASLGKVGSPAGPQRLAPDEPGDIAVSGHALTLLKRSMGVLSPYDCWRLCEFHSCPFYP
jgi:hypothetical protein